MRSHGIRLICWRLLSALAFVLMLAAVFWHRSVTPPPVSLVVPPYTVPVIAKSALVTADLPDTGGHGWLPVQDGPPENGLFKGTGRYRADIRQIAVVGAWQRTWESADAEDGVQIQIFEMRRNQFARAQLALSCRPQTRLTTPNADVSGFEARNRNYTSACAGSVRGRTAVVVHAKSSRTTAAELAERTVADLFRRQLPRVPISPDLAAISLSETSAHIAVESEAMLIGLGIPLVLGLSILLRDPSSWRRLRSWRSKPSRAGVFSIDRLVTGRMAASTAAVLVRLCVYGWTVRLCEIAHLGTVATLFSGVAAVAAVLVVEWLLRRRRPRRWRPAAFDGPWKLVALLGVTVTAAVATVGVFFILLGSDMEALGVNFAGGSDYVTGQVGFVLRLAGLLVVLASLLPFTLLRRIGMRRLRDQTDKDHRPHTLMLRSFADDRRTLRARRLDRASVLERLCMRRFERFEEVAAAALAVHGPVIALSQQGERLPPPLGAVRRSYAWDDWQDGVNGLIDGAQLICVTLGRSRSLVLEIERIRDVHALDRTIFVLPPTSRGEQRRRLAVLGDILGLEWAQLDRTRPGTDVLAVTFPAGRPVIITGRAPNDVGYEAAIEIAALAVTGDVSRVAADTREAVTAYLEHAATPSDIEASDGGPEPEVVIHAPGTAPEYLPWWRRLKFKHWAFITSTVVTAAATLQLGAAPDDVADLTLPGPATALVQDRISDATYAVLSGHRVIGLDFKDRKARAVARINDGVDGLVVHGTSAYYVSTLTGRVGRVDLRDGRALWTRPVGVGARTIALAEDGERLVVTSPAAGTVVALAADDGHVMARGAYAGAPYGVVLTGGRLFVSLALRDEVIELNPTTLTEKGRWNVPSGPRELVAQGTRLWVRSTVAHVLQSVSTDASATRLRLLMSDQRPPVSGNGRWLAVLGMERVTVLSPGNRLRRIPVPDPSVPSLLVERDGAVIVGTHDGLLTRFA